MALSALWLVLGVAACSSDEGGEGSAAVASPDKPLAGQSFWVDPRSPAALQAERWRAEGRTDEADAMARLASRPTAHWLAEGGDVEADVRSAATRAARAGRSALLVAYWIPGRDCGSYSAGGAGSAAAYRDWIGRFARGLGNRRAVVIVEPDAVAQTVTGCLKGAAREERLALLAHAVRILSAKPRTTVYLDAGNAGWVRPPARLARPLRKAGVARADGFALNVSNFYRTGTSARYGRALARRLGRAHFVIDTSRNGNGPSPAAGGPPNWCNPPGRALGHDPTTDTGRPRVDAYLWVKEPGASDGACRAGAPPAGQWWPEYALELARGG
jgi:endoglucanase